jgi:ribosomal subunit interface protein
MDPSEAVEERIRAKAAELERFSDRITSCHVTVAAPHKHRHQGNVYAVHIEIHLPGKTIAVGRDRPQSSAHQDVYVAVRDAFDAASRQLEDYVRVQRGDVKEHSLPGARR